MLESNDKQLESAASQSSEKSLIDDVKAAMRDFVKTAQEHTQKLKGGAESKITNQFGKPVIEGLEPTGASRSRTEDAQIASLGKAAAQDNIFGQNSLESKVGMGSAPPGGGVLDATPATPAAPAAASSASGSIELAASPYGSAYKGEGLTENIAAGQQAVDKDSSGNLRTIAEIAKDHLEGQGVYLDAQQLQKYMREVAEVNHITSTTMTHEGATIMLPGHNKSGDLIVQELDDTERTVRADGSASLVDPLSGKGFEYKPTQGGGYIHRSFDSDGTTHTIERIPDRDGGYTEWHTGWTSEGFAGDYSYQITRTSDGTYEIMEDGSLPWDKTEYDPEYPDPRIERARLSDIAQGKITDPADRQRFQQDIEDFERTAREQNLTPEERARLYHEVTRLMEAGDSSNSDLPDATDRVHIAEQIMSHAANPQLIDQGNHGTCAVAALESQLFTRNPAAAARVIVDVATNGAFETTSGRRVELHPSLLKADNEASEHPMRDKNRSYASQLFQSAAIASEYRSFKVVTPTGPSDTGERCDLEEVVVNKPGSDLAKAVTSKAEWAEHLQKYNDGELAGKENPFLGLDVGEIERINKEIAGDANSLSVLKHSSVPPGDAGLNVSSEQELAEQLKSLSDDGKLPALIYVDSRHEPFLSDSGGAAAGGAGGGHWVTVRAFDARSGIVSFDNQWGKNSDHVASLDVLYKATLPVV